MNIQIDTDKYNKLLAAQAKLECLEAAGVDNWDGYDIALEPLRKAEERREQLEEFVDEIRETIADYIEEPAGRGCGYGLKQEADDHIVKVLERICAWAEKNPKAK